MILVTVGMQLGFDRLIAAVDNLAPSLDEEVFAQVGNGTYEARNIETARSISPVEFDKLIAQTHLIIAHAGIGTVLTAQRFKKPILVFPRRAALGEHRNDHQLATAAQLKGRDGIIVVEDERDLLAGINAGMTLHVAQGTEAPQRDQLKQAIRNFVINGNLRG